VVDIPFTASDFSTPTGGATWTVTGVATFAYTKIGKTVILWLTILSTGTITGAPVRLRVTLPPAIIPPARASEGVPFIYGLAGASINGTGVCSFNGNQLDFLRDIGGTTFPAGATFLYLTFPYSL
jgi:hypothetical protein